MKMEGNIQKAPFRKYNLEEDFTKKDVFSVRVNKEERAIIEDIKEMLDIKSDSTALKFAAEVGRNVLLNTFGKDRLRYLFKNDRHRLSDYK